MDPDQLKYSKHHTWVSVAGDEGTIGITDYAQESLGDIVYVDVPEEEEEVEAGEEVAEVESTKATSSVIAPVSGTVIEVNDDIEDSPDTINEDPYGDGWIVRVQLSEPSELKGLMTAAAYAKFIEEEIG